ncbi:WhiB family transcriptional regulator [Streptomyces zaomyceticus]|uniref:WhiB family transcriptional regulator n=1 Tax=Streptomyces zaomyceticus TaxID=68286 RepID=UPI0036B2623D
MSLHPESTPITGVRIASSDGRSAVDAEGPLCAGRDPSMFFPDRLGRGGGAQLAAGKRVCFACPIRFKCLANAIRLDAEYGTWGGFTSRERKRMSAQMITLRVFDQRLIEQIATGNRVDIDVQLRPMVAMGLYRRGWNDRTIARALKIAPFAIRVALKTQRDLEFYKRAYDWGIAMYGKSGEV